MANVAQPQALISFLSRNNKSFVTFIATIITSFTSCRITSSHRAIAITIVTPIACLNDDLALIIGESRRMITWRSFHSSILSPSMSMSCYVLICISLAPLSFLFFFAFLYLCLSSKLASNAVAGSNGEVWTVRWRTSEHRGTDCRTRPTTTGHCLANLCAARFCLSAAIWQDRLWWGYSHSHGVENVF